MTAGSASGPADSLGFEVHARYDDEQGQAVHVELTFGTSMLMLASPGNGEHGHLLNSVVEAGKPTGGFYVVVVDADHQYERARQAGLEILSEPRPRDHGGREFSCRDHEGHLWTFGTYDPGRSTNEPPTGGRRSTDRPPPLPDTGWPCPGDVNVRERGQGVLVVGSEGTARVVADVATPQALRLHAVRAGGVRSFACKDRGRWLPVTGPRRSGLSME